MLPYSEIISSMYRNTPWAYFKGKINPHFISIEVKNSTNDGILGVSFCKYSNFFPYLSYFLHIYRRKIKKIIKKT